MRRADRPQRRRLRVTSLNALIPNMTTALALASGLTGMRFAMEGRWQFAVGAVALAALLDTLDGRLARLLKHTSKFGAELDSLSDFVAFGVTPAVMLYLWSSQALGAVGWIATLFFATCMALRLARFNTRLEDPDLPPFAYRFFTGVPAPAAAGLGLLPMMMSFELEWAWLQDPVLIAVWCAVVGLLMVSRFPTYSFKGVRVPGRLVLPMLIVVGLLVASLVSKPWTTLGVVIFAYMGSFALSYRSYRRYQKSAEAEKAAVAETDGTRMAEN